MALLTFLGSWNDLFGPLIYLNTQEKMTVQLGLAFLRGRAGTGVGQFGIIMAGSLLGVLPMLTLYAIGQKYFIQGLARAGLKVKDNLPGSQGAQQSITPWSTRTGA